MSLAALPLEETCYCEPEHACLGIIDDLTAEAQWQLTVGEHKQTLGTP
jgi:hypothetical protein